MQETSLERIAWRRQGLKRHYVGTLHADGEGIELSGREPGSGIQVALTIPAHELERVRVSGPGDERLVGERCVVLELANSEAIFLREVGVGPLHVHLLARALGGLVHPPVRPPALVAQGG